MEAQSQQGFQDPLSAAAAETEKTSACSSDHGAEVEPSAPADRRTPSIHQQAPEGDGGDGGKAGHEGNEGAETLDVGGNDATDSSSNWSPEVLQANDESVQMRLRA